MVLSLVKSLVVHTLQCLYYYIYWDDVFLDGEKFQAKLDLLQACAVSSLRMCVVSEYEMDKCEQMLLALKSKNLKVRVMYFNIMHHLLQHFPECPL